MKRSALHIILILFTMTYYSCEKPLPTELTPEKDQQTGSLEIEVLSSDPDSPEYSSSYDTTGFISPFKKASTVVLFNNIKNTYKTKTNNIITARAYFFDKSSPIISQGKLLGYKTHPEGVVTFGNKIARLDRNVIKFRARGAVKDTSTGPFYSLKRWDGSGDDIEYKYGSSISFRVVAPGREIFQEEIVTPAEINGKVEVNHSGNSKVYKLTWNGSNNGKIEIIIGGIKKQKKELFPLYKFRTADNGELLIPKTLLEKIPAQLFERISFSFIRRIERSYNTNSVVKDIYIASQSIHSIQLDTD